MAHFARIQDGVVREVIVVGNEYVATEADGKAFIASCGIQGEFVQTSYNANFRGKYAGVGDVYDSVNDIFITPSGE
jgi:hypothetical protein